jgi:hypothetical protein
MESVDAYKAANGWKEYKDDIVGYVPNNQIYYTATAELVPENNSWGVEMTAHTYDPTTKVGVMTFSGDVKKVPSGGFNGNANLMTISLPETVTIIYGNAFKNCTALTEITIPASVGKINTEAFYGCIMLSAVYCKSATPPTLGTDVFKNNASDRKIYVPATADDSVLNAYKAAWSAYATSIEEEQ